MIALFVTFSMTVLPVIADPPATNRPDAWARPITLAGVPNFHEVTSNLFRSAQPTAEGMRNLKQFGIRTVVNLRSFHSDRDELADTGLAAEHITMKAWHPEQKEIVQFLKLATDAQRAPLLVHCQHGADRTGTMCAVYRIVVQGWTKEEALREMTEGGFGFHEVWQNLPRWIAELDIAALRREAGLNDPGTPETAKPVPDPGRYSMGTERAREARSTRPKSSRVFPICLVSTRNVLYRWAKLTP